MMTPADKLAFMTHTRMGRFLWAVAGMVMWFTGMFGMLFVLWSIETRWFPVITDFKIHRLELVADAYVMEGSFRKHRPCEMLVTNVLAVPRQPLAPSHLVHQLKTDVIGGNAPTGLTTWGPLSVPFPAKVFEHIDKIDRVEVRGTHRCHPLWNIETVYASLDPKELPR